MFKKLLLFATCVLLLASCDKKPIEPEKPSDDKTSAFNPAIHKIILSYEFRGVWLATVSGTDCTALHSSTQPFMTAGCLF